MFLYILRIYIHICDIRGVLESTYAHYGDTRTCLEGGILIFETRLSLLWRVFKVVVKPICREMLASTCSLPSAITAAPCIFPDLHLRHHKTNAMTAQMQVLGKQTRDHDLVLAKEYVSRQQVQEMETLFATAVEGLNNRLRNMETRNVDDNQHVSSGGPTSHRPLTSTQKTDYRARPTSLPTAVVK